MERHRSQANHAGLETERAAPRKAWEKPFVILQTLRDAEGGAPHSLDGVGGGPGFSSNSVPS